MCRCTSAAPGCLCMGRPGVNLGYHFSGALILETESVTGLDLSSMARLADWPVRPRITNLHRHAGFLCGFWKTDLGFYACEARTLPTEQLLWSL